MKAWTTNEQRAWLAALVPQWRKRRAHKSTEFLETTVTAFLTVFPDCGYDRPTLRAVSLVFSYPPLLMVADAQQKVQQWFHNHGKEPQSKKSTSAPIDLINHHRKPVPLTKAQAYSLLFCKKDTPLHRELREAWKLYTAGDEGAHKQYAHLFPTQHSPNLPFVSFQQVILREKVTTATEEELDAIDQFIVAQFEEETDLHKHPWKALRIDDCQPESDLQRQYIEE